MDSEPQTTHLHLLLVDDNPRYLAELEAWLRNFGYHHLTLARSEAEARQLLQQVFDVIVVDMKLEQEESGLAIIEEIKRHTTASIVIVLTANDTVQNCRKAFKLGVWDYISKNWRGNVFEMLHQSIQDGVNHFSRWGNVKDKKWIADNMGELLESHQGQYVAVLNNAIIASADTREELEKLIHERNLPLFLTIIEKIGADLFKQLTENLIVFVEGPTDIRYIRTALKVLGHDNLLKSIVLDTIGSGLGDRGSGDSHLKSGFEFLKNNRLLTNKVLSLFDRDVRDGNLPNRGQDFENLYIRRVDDYSRDKKGIESLLSEALLEEGVAKGLVKKTIVQTIQASGSETRHTYQVTNKTGFCDWVCGERKNSPADFAGFQKTIDIIRTLSAS
jgi:CheY-like chemotaxis protein